MLIDGEWLRLRTTGDVRPVLVVGVLRRRHGDWLSERFLVDCGARRHPARGPNIGRPAWGPDDGLLRQVLADSGVGVWVPAAGTVTDIGGASTNRPSSLHNRPAPMGGWRDVTRGTPAPSKPSGPRLDHDWLPPSGIRGRLLWSYFTPVRRFDRFVPPTWLNSRSASPAAATPAHPLENCCPGRTVNPIRMPSVARVPGPP